jgi:hypothetical protein
MEFALGVLKWTPEVFWRSTSFETFAAARGHSSQYPKKEEGMTPNEFQDLMDKFPDEG